MTDEGSQKEKTIIDVWICDVFPGGHDEISWRRHQELAGATDWVPHDFLRCFKFFLPGECKVIIVGQDPYHSRSKKTGLPIADGLSFSCQDGAKVPPSLQSILKQLSLEYEGPPRRRTDLSDWAEQGVLMLNTVLTVKIGKAGSHRGVIGWEGWTLGIVKKLISMNPDIILLLMGGVAEKSFKSIKCRGKIVVGHPSPLNRKIKENFFGQTIFREINWCLADRGLSEIDWFG